MNGASAPRTIFFAERGHTATTLIDQPAFFVQTSTIMSDIECAAQLRQWDDLTSEDLLSLATEETRRSRALELIAALAETGKCTAWISVKDFLLILFMIDYWVRPGAEQRGIDLFEGDVHLKLANQLWTALPPRDPDHRIVFLSMDNGLRLRNPDRIASFWTRFEHAVKQLAGAAHDATDMLLWGASQDVILPYAALDPSFAAIGATLAHWQSRYDGPVEIVHDEYGWATRHKDWWGRITRALASRYQVVGLDSGDTSHVVGATKATAAPQLEVCRRLADITLAWCRPTAIGRAPEFSAAMRQAGLHQIMIGGLIPNTGLDSSTLGAEW